MCQKRNNCQKTGAMLTSWHSFMDKERIFSKEMAKKCHWLCFFIYLCRVKHLMTLWAWGVVLTTISLFFLSVSSCRRPQENRCILPDSVELRAGDVVFRQGGGLESHAVLALDRDGEYSHVGIVVDTMGQKMIVHAVPGEPDFEGDPDRVKLDSIGKFFSSVLAIQGAVMRMDDSIVAKRASQKALEVFRRGVLFDGDYNFEDSTTMYCTELVQFVYQSAGVKLVTGEPEHVVLPLVDAEVYLPSTIYHSKHLRPISIF